MTSFKAGMGHSAVRFTVLISLLLALILPVGYFLISYENLIGVMETEANINARLVSVLINENPELWRYETVRLEHLLSQRLNSSATETRRLLDNNNRVVVENDQAVPSPVVKASYQIISNGEPVGRIEISRSLLPLLLNTLVLLGVGAVMGVLLYRWLPFQALVKMGEKLQDAHDFLDRVMQGSAVSLAVVDVDGNVMLCNQRFSDMVGLPGEVPLGRPFSRLFPDDAMPIVKTVLNRVSADRETSVDFEVEFPQKDGTVRSHSGVAVPLSSHGEASGVIFSIHDISKRKLLEEKLRQSVKMESVGRLAGGVAHDFNNKLTVILGYIDLLKLDFRDNLQVRQKLDRMCQAAEGSRDLTKQLLTFSRQQVVSPRSINPRAFLENAQVTLPRLIGEDIVVSYHLPDDLWNVKVDPVQLDQIILNIAVNARDAMACGGKLSIEAVNVSMEENHAKELEVDPGEYVLLRFSDNGMGMDAETLKHVFEPFFTTKEIGKGTGLGLAAIYGIVKQNMGGIVVESLPGHGTTFNIYLPRMEEEIIPEIQHVSEPVEGGGTVLLVEDEEIVRIVLLRWLEKQGYKVLAPETPFEAIALCENKMIGIDLVLSDIIMPGMNGKEMVDRIKMIRPGIKVIFMSGYTNDILTSEHLLDEGVKFIGKPFDLHVLVSMINEELETLAQASG